MKRFLPILVLGATALAPFAASAQMRGGGMAGRGGGMAGRGGGMAGRGPAVSRGPARSGPAFAPRVSPAFVSSRPAGARSFAPSGRVVFTSGPFPGHFNRFHRSVFFPQCLGAFPCQNGFFFGAGFGSGFGFGAPLGGYPYSYYPYYSSDYSSAPPATVVSSDNGNEIALAREVQQLSDQIESLRYEQSRQAAPERQSTPAPSGSSLSMSARAPAASTTFVMRDGSHIAAQNYAIAGQTIWIFDEHRARKIALADLDRAATEQVNAANGNDLRLP